MNCFKHDIDCGAGARTLRAYIPDVNEQGYYSNRRPAVIIFPGGAYHYTSENEAEPVALAFAAAGICAFILDYSTASITNQVFPYAQLEAFASIRYVRENADSFGIQADNVCALGFSAGGHLCACTGTLWNKPIMEQYLGDAPKTCRPDKMILCYPVIRAFPPCNSGSFSYLLGTQSTDAAMLEQLSLERQVDNNTPPSFIWMTAEDKGVPIQGALEFAHALVDSDVYVEMHLYPHGAHGLSLGNHLSKKLPYRNPHTCSEWLQGAIRFIFDDEVTPPIVPLC